MALNRIHLYIMYYIQLLNVCLRKITFSKKLQRSVLMKLLNETVSCHGVFLEEQHSLLCSKKEWHRKPYSKHRTRVDKVMFSEQGTVTLELLLLRHCYSERQGQTFYSPPCGCSNSRWYNITPSHFTSPAFTSSLSRQHYVLAVRFIHLSRGFAWGS